MNFLKDDQNRNPLDYYGLRQAAVKQELMPSYKSITKPTRDIQASNRSHSLSKQDLNGSYNNRILTSQKKIMMLQKQLEECQFERQANIVYNRQFRQIGRVLGNQNMQFDQIKQKIEDLILQGPQIQHHQFQNQQNYQTKVFKQQIEALQKQLQIKNNILSQLGQKKRYSSKELQQSINFAQTHQFQQQVLKLKKQQESYILKIKSYQTKIDFMNAQIESLKLKQLNFKNSQNENKLLYKGVYISANTLLKQLSHRDQQLLNQNYYLIEIRQKLQKQQKKSAERDISQNTIDKNLRQAQSRIFMLEQDKRRSQNQIRSLKFDLQTNKMSLKSYQQRVSQYQKRIDVLNLKNIEMEQKNSKGSDNQFEINQVRKKLKEQEQQIIKLGSYIQKRNFQNEQLKSNNQKFQLQKVKLQKQYKQLSEIYSTLRDSFQKLNIQNSNSKKELSQLSIKYQQSCLNMTSLQKSYNSIKQMYEQLTQKYSNSNLQYSLNMKKITSTQAKNQNSIQQYVSTIQVLQNKLKLQIENNQSLQTQLSRLKQSLEQLQKNRHSGTNILEKRNHENNFLITRNQNSISKNLSVSFQDNIDRQANNVSKYDRQTNNIDRQSNNNSRLNPIRSMEKIQNNVSNIESHEKSVTNTKQYYQYEYFNKYSQNNLEEMSNVRISESHYKKQKEVNNQTNQILYRQIQLIQRGSQVQFKHNADNNKYQLMIISLQERIKHLQLLLQKYSDKSFNELQEQNQSLKRKIRTMQQQVDELNIKIEELNVKIASKNQASSVNKYSGSFGRANNQKANGQELQSQTIKVSHVQINLNSSNQSRNQQHKITHYSNISKYLQQFQIQIISINANLSQMFQVFKNKILSYVQTIDIKVKGQQKYQRKKYLDDYEGQQISKLTKKSCVQDQKLNNDNFSGSELKFQKRQEIHKSNQISKANVHQTIEKSKIINKNQNQNQSDVGSNSNNQSHGQLSRKILNQNFQKQSQDQLSRLSDKMQHKKQSQSKIQQTQNAKNQYKPSHASLVQQKNTVIQKNEQIMKTIRQNNTKSIHEKIKDLMEIQKEQSSNILPQYSNKNKKHTLNHQVLNNNALIIQTPIQNGTRPLSTIHSNSSMISHNSALISNQVIYKQINKQSSLSHQKRQNSSKSINNRPPSRVSINYGNTSKVIYTSKSPLSGQISPISPIKSGRQSIILRPSYISPTYGQVKKQQSRKSSINGQEKKQFTDQNSFSKQLNRENILRHRQNYQLGYQQSLPIYSSKQVIGRKSNKNIIFNQLKSSKVSQSKRSYINSPQNYTYADRSVIQKLKKETIVNDEYYPVNSQFSRQLQNPQPLGNAPGLYNTNSNIYSTISSTGRFIQNKQASNYDNYRANNYVNYETSNYDNHKTSNYSNHGTKAEINQNNINNSSNKETIFMHKNLVGSNISSQKLQNKTINIMQNKNLSNESFNESQDSGIDVLQYDKGFNCCKH